MEFPVIYGKLGAKGGARGDYFQFVKEYQEKHPELSWKQAVKKASGPYRQYIGVPKKPKKAGAMAGAEAGILAGAVKDMPMPTAEDYREYMLKAHKMFGAAWYGDKSGHSKAAKKGWMKRKEE